MLEDFRANILKIKISPNEASEIIKLSQAILITRQTRHLRTFWKQKTGQFFLGSYFGILNLLGMGLHYLEECHQTLNPVSHTHSSLFSC